MTTSRRTRRFQRRADERRSLRQQTVERFGDAADERTTTDRRRNDRKTSEQILKDMGLEDRRRGDRRR
jgi:hypothetical protein